jgi:hypothetical protein
LTTIEWLVVAGGAWVMLWVVVAAGRRRWPIVVLLLAVCTAAAAATREWRRGARPVAVVGPGTPRAAPHGCGGSTTLEAGAAVRWGAATGAGSSAALGRCPGLAAGRGAGASVSLRVAVCVHRRRPDRGAKWSSARVGGQELVENALDAGAPPRPRRDRGRRPDADPRERRRGRDGPRDARLAVSAATSKIRAAADLVGVGSFGFRGEALPAIASVARFELETSPDGASGTTLRVTGGTFDAPEDAVRQRGTTVTVRGLFFNTPARRKFLRAPATETRAATEALTVLALARPDVAFTLQVDGRVALDVPGAARRIDRIEALWGRAFADTLLAVTHRAGPLEVTGFADARQATPAGRKATCSCGAGGARPVRAAGGGGRLSVVNPATAPRCSCSSTCRVTRSTSTCIRPSSRCGSATSSSSSRPWRRPCGPPSRRSRRRRR